MKLNGNSLTALSQSVFQTIVESFVVNGYSSGNTFIDASSSNKSILYSLDFRFFINRLIYRSQFGLRDSADGNMRFAILVV